MNLINVVNYPSTNPLTVDEPDQRCEIPFDKLLCVLEKFRFVILSTLEKRLSDCNV